MQILDVNIHTDRTSAPQAAKLGESVADSSFRFDEALGSEQERRSIDDQVNKVAAKIAGESEQQSAGPKDLKTGQPAENTLSDESTEQSSADWHDFLQSLTKLDKAADGEELESVTAGSELAVLGSGVATKAESSSVSVTVEEPTEMLALLDQFGINLTDKEKHNLLVNGKLIATLVTKINDALNVSSPVLSVVELQQQLTQLLPVQTEQTAATAAELPLIDSLSDEQQAELNEALAELVKGNPEALKEWLAKQNLSAELKQPLLNLINETAGAIASLTNAELLDEIKIQLAEVFSAVVTLTKVKQSTDGNANLAPDSTNKLQQTIQQLTDRLSSIDTTVTRQSVAEQAGASQVAVQQVAFTPPALVAPPAENKVLLAFSNAAQELRAVLQDSARDDSRDVPLMRGFEQQLTAHVVADGAKNINPSFMVGAQQTPVAQPAVTAQAVRAMPSPSQQVDTPFEQARQNQQYLDITSPQAPVQLKDQIAVMFNNRNQVAEMRLDPPELGRLNIRLQMSGEQQASVAFIVNSPQAREAIEHAMPRLREMLEEQGIQLTDSNVREESSQLAQESGQQQKGGKEGMHSSADSEEALDEEPMHLANVETPKGLIDYYV